MSLASYLKLNKMELFKTKIKLSTEIVFKIMLQWLINKNHLKKQQEAKNKQRFATVISVNNDNKAKKLCTNGFCFGRVVKVDKKYWNAGLGSICIRYCDIKYERLHSYSDRLEKFFLYTRSHQASNYQCSIDRYSKNIEKQYTHLIV